MRKQILSVEAMFRRWGKVAMKLRPTPTIQEKFPQFDIGRGTYGVPLIRSWRGGSVFKIGAFCSIAANVQIFLGGEHRVDWTTTYPFSALWPSARHIGGHPCTRGDVVIGNDVWLGAEAMIMSGVSIGDGAVVGARAVVTKDVPPYCVAAGNPARVIRTRFPDDVVERLLALRWWDWSDSKIEKYLPMMLSTDVTGFLVAAESESGDGK